MKMFVKKIKILFLGVALLVTAVSCAQSATQVSTPTLTTEQWNFPDNTFAVWFDENGSVTDYQTIRVGKTGDGKDIFALLRIPLKGTWLADEIHEARLFLKPESSENSEHGVPQNLSAVRIGILEKDLSFSDMSDEAVRGAAGNLTSVAVREEADDRVSIPVKEYIKTWLDGDMRNTGFVIFGEKSGELGIFVSDGAEDNTDRPYLEVSGAVGARPLTYGKFAYHAVSETDGGNCMSYALRDTDDILEEDVGLDFNEMNRIYTESGEDAVADYTAGVISDYVRAHKDGLRISTFRRIDDFDSEIDPAAEYRIALRVGCKTYDGEPADLGTRGNFDYHFRAQVNDGQWAQKFPIDPSEIFPYTPPGVSPAKEPWDSATMWLDKFRDYYTSKTIFFAVTKDTDLFTRHKEG